MRRTRTANAVVPRHDAGSKFTLGAASRNTTRKPLCRGTTPDQPLPARAPRQRRAHESAISRSTRGGGAFGIGAHSAAQSAQAHHPPAIPRPGQQRRHQTSAIVDQTQRRSPVQQGGARNVADVNSTQRASRGLISPLARRWALQGSESVANSPLEQKEELWGVRGTERVPASAVTPYNGTIQCNDRRPSPGADSALLSYKHPA